MHATRKTSHVAPLMALAKLAALGLSAARPQAALAQPAYTVTVIWGRSAGGTAGALPSTPPGRSAEERLYIHSSATARWQPQCR
jgi:hypothetical protein